MHLRLKAVLRGGSLALHLPKEINDQFLHLQEGDTVTVTIDEQTERKPAERRAQTPDKPKKQAQRRAQTPQEE